MSRGGRVQEAPVLWILVALRGCGKLELQQSQISSTSQQSGDEVGAAVAWLGPQASIGSLKTRGGDDHEQNRCWLKKIVVGGIPK